MSLVRVQSSQALASHLLFFKSCARGGMEVWSAPTLRELSLREGSAVIRLADGVTGRLGRALHGEAEVGTLLSGYRESREGVWK